MNYLDYRKKVEEKKLVVKEKEFFKSSEYKKYLSSLISATSQRYKDKIKLDVGWDEDFNSDLAWTDNEMIYVNSGHPYISSSKLEIKDKSRIVVGLIAHELGHILYTDFNFFKSFRDDIFDTKFDIEIETKKLIEFKEYLEYGLKMYLSHNISPTSKFILKTFHGILNILEDFYIEKELCDDFPGTFKKSLILKRSTFKKYLISLEDDLTSGNRSLYVLTNQILHYTLYDINNTNAYNGDLKIPLLEAFSCIDEYKLDYRNLQMRKETTVKIFFILWEYIKEILEDIKDNKINSEEEFKKLEKSSNNNNPENNNNLSKKIPSASSVDETKNDLRENNNDSNFDYQEFEFEKTLDDFVSEEVLEDLETDRFNDFVREVKKLDKQDNKKKVTFKVKRELKVPPERYEHLSYYQKELNLVSKKLSILSKNKKLTYKRFGLNERRLDVNALCVRNDINFYSKPKKPSKPDLSIAILVDESGSMNLDNRIEHAQKACLMLHSLCENLSIPICIYGHTEHENFEVTMYSYVEFESIDNKDKYRILNMHPKENNRDGSAIRFMYNKIAKRKEKNRIVIIISDGQPSAFKYGQFDAFIEIPKIKREAKRQGILTFACAIGDDLERIKELYEDSYLDMTNLYKLPENLMKLIDKYIK